jgi:ubiquinone/menaquinone biosynthesis C-methylase UbiE
MMEWQPYDGETYARELYASNPLRRENIQNAIDALELPEGGIGLDAGCGIGLQAILLARATGPGGRVIGLDISKELLESAVEIVEREGLHGRISFNQGDVRELPFDDGCFDWAWSADCAGYAPLGDPVHIIKELSRVVRTGGKVAILAWSSERLLPGHPRLEARLCATTPGIAPFREEMSPEHHFQRATGWFKEAGLEKVRGRTFVGEAQAPVGEETRYALESLIGMRWPGAEKELSEEDRELFQRICSPNSPEFILDEPDYYAFYTETMFWGTVP